MSYEAELQRIARSLVEIAGALESVDAPDERIRRTLLLTDDVVPYRTCALWKAAPGMEPTLVTVPSVSDDERDRLRSSLSRAMRFIGEDEDEIRQTSDDVHHLAVPLIGLDRVIGILRVEAREEVSYNATHLRLLSVVAAQLGAYLSLVRLHEAADSQARELAIVNQFQQRLVGIVGHDLRSPLSVIMMTASSLLEDTREPRRARIIERALRSAERATRLIDDLLDVTHARVTGELPIAPRPTDLRTLLEEVIGDARAASPGRVIELLEVGPNASTLGEWDADRIAQAVTNLVNNALTHGDPREAVRVRCSFEDDRAVVSVHNRGPSIAPALLPKIFDPFRRGAEPRKRAEGLGLGLYIVQEIASAHGGHVEARSSAEEGTMFTMTLPRRVPDDVRPTLTMMRPVKNDPGEGRASEPPHESAGRPLLMVVDDDPLVTEGLTEVLHRRGYRVASAANGEQALEALREGMRPKLILVDLHMPVMDGETFLKSCRRDPALAMLPAVVISSSADEALKVARSIDVDYMPKPFRVEALLERLDHLPG
jgi:signal transduction histidine kinase